MKKLTDTVYIIFRSYQKLLELSKLKESSNHFDMTGYDEQGLGKKCPRQSEARGQAGVVLFRYRRLPPRRLRACRNAWRAVRRDRTRGEGSL